MHYWLRLNRHKMVLLLLLFVVRLISSSTDYGWKVVLSKGTYGIYDIGEDDFNSIFQSSDHHIIRRECSNCVLTHQDIYYKRLTYLTTFKPYLYMSDYWFPTNNTLDTDFKLYSTLNDTLDDTNAWIYCNYASVGATNGPGFPRDCGPNGDQGGQWNTFNFNGGAGQPNIRFSIYVQLTNSPTINPTMSPTRVPTVSPTHVLKNDKLRNIQNASITYPYAGYGITCNLDKTLTQLIWCVGGNPDTENFVYSFDGTHFTQKQNLLNSFYVTQSVIVDGIIYLLEYNRYYISKYYISNGSSVTYWVSLPVNREHWRLTNNNNNNELLYVTNENYVYEFNITSKIFSQLPNLQTAHSLSTMAFYNNRLVIFGGKAYSNKIEYINLYPNDNSWSTSDYEEIIVDYMYGSGIESLDNGIVYIFGGISGQRYDTIIVYDITKDYGYVSNATLIIGTERITCSIDIYTQLWCLTGVRSVSPHNLDTVQKSNYPLLPTSNPTNSPTFQPTVGSTNPTNTPSNNPTKYPSQQPTSNPSSTPSEYPTNNPTNDPTPFIDDRLTEITNSSVKFPIQNHGAACLLDDTITNQIWCLGGYDSPYTVYSFDGNTFTNETYLTNPFTDASVVIVNGVAYLIEYYIYYITRYFIVDGTTDYNWQSLPGGVAKVSARIATNNNDMLFVHGNEAVRSFNLTTSVWESLPNLNTLKAGGGFAYYNNRLAVIGGTTYSNRLEYINLNPVDSSWTISNYISLVPSNHANMAVVTLNTGIVYLIGGNSGGARLTSIYVYDMRYDFMYLSDVELTEGRDELYCTLDTHKKMWCFGGWLYLIGGTDLIEESNFPLEPTFSPTMAPTMNPTMTTSQPTSVPSQTPTNIPTNIPTKSPSITTDNPTRNPTNVPTEFTLENDKLTSLTASSIVYPYDVFGLSCNLDETITNEIWCFGGTSGSGEFYKRVYMFNGTHFSRQNDAVKNFKLAYGVIVNGIIYMLEYNNLDLSYYNISDGTSVSNWIQLPISVTHVRMVATEDPNIFYFNGHTYAFRLNISNQSFYNLPDTQERHKANALGYYNRRLVIFGGQSLTHKIEYIDVDENPLNWSTSAYNEIVPDNLYGCDIVALKDGLVYVLGGVGNKDLIIVYDIPSDSGYVSDVTLTIGRERPACSLDIKGQMWCFGGYTNVFYDIVEYSNYPLLSTENPIKAPTMEPTMTTINPTNTPTNNPTQLPTTTPTNQPTNSPSSDAVINDPNGCGNLDGGGWELVRHTSASYNKMHPTNDDGKGSPSEVYGSDYYNDALSDNNWSKDYTTNATTQFLFASGDCQLWGIMTYNEIFVNAPFPYSNEDKCLLASNLCPKPYTAKMYLRNNGRSEDPWLSVTDHSYASSNKYIIYGEGGWGTPHSESFSEQGGGNVWIRQKPDETRDCSEGAAWSETNSQWCITEPPTITTSQPTSVPSQLPTNNPTNIPTQYPSITTDNPSKNPTSTPTEYTLDDRLTSLTASSIVYPYDVYAMSCNLDETVTQKIWCVGGTSGSGEYYKRVYSFDGTNFIREADAIKNFKIAQGVIVHGIIYVLEYNNIELSIYNISDGTSVATFIPLPVSITHTRVVATEDPNILYFNVDVYAYRLNISNQSFYHLPNTKVRHQANVLGYYNKRLVIFGGETTVHQIEYYDTDSGNSYWNTSQYEHLLTSNVDHMDIVSLNNGIVYVIGGKTTVDDILVYDIPSDFAYVSDVTLTIGRMRASCSLDIKGQMWCFGGYTNVFYDIVEYSNYPLLPTPNPIKAPTVEPTVTTINPTKIPSSYPTRNPSNNPTSNPSNMPTLYPTNNPTDDPTPFVDDRLTEIKNSSVKFPTKNHRAACLLDDTITNEIWCLGGYDSPYTVYSFDGNTFKNETYLTNPFTDASAVIVNGVAYLIEYNIYYITRYFIVDGTTDYNWKSLPGGVAKVSSRIASNNNDMLYVHGFEAVRSLNLTTLVWESLPNLNTLKAGGGFTYYNNRLAVIGGTTYTNRLEYINLNPVDSSWTISNYISLVPSDHANMAVVTLNNGIVYLIGGNSGGAPLTSIYVYDMRYDYMYLSDTQLTEGRDELYCTLDTRKKIWCFGGWLYLIGGTDLIEESNFPLEPTQSPTMTPTMNPTMITSSPTPYVDDKLVSLSVASVLYPKYTAGQVCDLDYAYSKRIWCFHDYVFSFDGTQFYNETRIEYGMRSYGNSISIMNDTVYLIADYRYYLETYNLVTDVYNNTFSPLPAQIQWFNLKGNKRSKMIYICCSISDSSFSYMFNISSNEWVSLPELSIGHREGGMVYYNDILAIIGGRGVYSDKIEFMNVNEIQNGWTTSEYENSLADSLIAFTTNVVNDLVYIIGGIEYVTGDTRVDYVFVYDINNDYLYKSNVTLNYKRSYHSCAVDANSKLWCFGGWGTLPQNIRYVEYTSTPIDTTFNPTNYPSSQPTLIPSETPTNIPTNIPTQTPSITTNNPSGNPTGVPTEFDLENDKLTSLTTASVVYPYDVFALSCNLDETITNKIWCFGGTSGSGEFYKRVYTFNGTHFTRQNDAAKNFKLAHGVIVNGIIYMLEYNNLDLSYYNISDGTSVSNWIQLPISVTHVRMVATEDPNIFYFNGHIYAFRLNISNQSFYHLPDTQERHKANALGYYNRRLVIFGGQSLTHKIEYIDVDETPLNWSTSAYNEIVPDNLYGCDIVPLKDGLVYVLGGVGNKDLIIVYDIPSDSGYVSDIALTIGRERPACSLDTKAQMWCFGGYTNIFYDIVEYTNFPLEPTPSPTVKPTMNPTIITSSPTPYVDDKLVSLSISSVLYPKYTAGQICDLDYAYSKKIWCFHDYVFSFDGTQFYNETQIEYGMRSYGNSISIMNDTVYLIADYRYYLETYNLVTGVYNNTFSPLPAQIQWFNLKGNKPSKMIYICCSISDSSFSHMFNITANKWVSLPELSIGHREGGMVYHNDILAIIGGRGVYSDKIEFMNVNEIQNGWTTSEYEDSLADSLIAFTTNVVNDLVYIIGGIEYITGDTRVDYIFVYDINNDYLYKSNVTLNYKRSYHSCAVDANSKLWCFGGWGTLPQNIRYVEYSSTPIDTTFSPTNYPTSQPTLIPSQTPTDIPTGTPTQTPSISTNNPSANPTSVPTEFHLQNDKLTSLTTSSVVYPYDVFALSCNLDETITHEIWCFGGTSGSSEFYKRVYTFNGTHFSRQNDAVKNFKLAYGVIVNGIIYMLEYNNLDLSYYNISDGTSVSNWIQLPISVTHVRMVATEDPNIFYFNGHIYAFRLNISNQSFYHLPDTQERHKANALGYYNRRLVIFGGQSLTHKIEYIDVDETPLNWSTSAYNEIVPDNLYGCDIVPLKDGLVYVLGGVGNKDLIIVYDIPSDSGYVSDVTLTIGRERPACSLDTNAQMWCFGGYTNVFYDIVEYSNYPLMPTPSPTVRPTQYPTDTTSEPSEDPSEVPTILPSDNPSQYPTLYPSKDPTAIPTINPTVEPTNLPSVNPTQYPTNNPSVTPTEDPSNNPSLAPTNNPSTYPTVHPTSDPSITPTQDPSNEPSLTPTKYPSDYPSVYPTSFPSSNPTNNPSNNPTKYPSNDPSEVPTVHPSDNPSLTPTNIPTLTPSEIPSKNPTMNPSSNPTMDPTENPTFNPSKSPTKSPSSNPSVTPTVEPTNNPSNSPSKHPTMIPSSNPSESPTIGWSRTRQFTIEFDITTLINQTMLENEYTSEIIDSIINAFEVLSDYTYNSDFRVEIQSIQQSSDNNYKITATIETERFRTRNNLRSTSTTDAFTVAIEDNLETELNDTSIIVSDASIVQAFKESKADDDLADWAIAMIVIAAVLILAGIGYVAFKYSQQRLNTKETEKQLTPNKHKTLELVHTNTPGPQTKQSAEINGETDTDLNLQFDESDIQTTEKDN